MQVNVDQTNQKIRNSSRVNLPWSNRPVIKLQPCGLQSTVCTSSPLVVKPAVSLASNSVNSLQSKSGQTSVVKLSCLLTYVAKRETKKIGRTISKTDFILLRYPLRWWSNVHHNTLFIHVKWGVKTQGAHPFTS